jgi:hypothetical protein
MRPMSSRPTRWAAAAILAALAGGCGLLYPDRWEERRDVLEHYRSLWRSHGIETYHFVHSETGETQRAAAGPVHVVVTDGVITEVAPLTVTDVEPDPDGYWTVEGMFDYIRDAIHGRPDQFQVVYNTVVGYPTLVNIMGGAVDDHITFWIDDLEEGEP